MATNTLGFDERLKAGKNREREIFAYLEGLNIIFSEGRELVRVSGATPEQDMHEKIDAWGHLSDGSKISIQLKYRDRGTDLGIAAVRPYTTHEEFKRDMARERVQLDRDMKTTPDLYVCLADEGRVLMLVSGLKVHKAVNLMLLEFASLPYFYDRSFMAKKYPGADLRIVTDRGGGYSAGQQKIVVYLNQNAIKAFGGKVYAVRI